MGSAQLVGIAETLSGCAKALSAKPDAQDMERLGKAARMFGVRLFSDEEAEHPKAVGRRFDERFLVPGSKRFVPLSENAVREAHVRGEHVCYGPVTGRFSDHVIVCYRKTDFDARAFAGSNGTMPCRPDGLSVEIAFVAGLLATAAKASDVSGTYLRLAKEFLGQHVLVWTPLALSLMQESGNDCYTRIVSFVGTICEHLADDEQAPGLL